MWWAFCLSSSLRTLSRFWIPRHHYILFGHILPYSEWVCLLLKASSLPMDILFEILWMDGTELLAMQALSKRVLFAAGNSHFLFAFFLDSFIYDGHDELRSQSKKSWVRSFWETSVPEPEQVRSSFEEEKTQFFWEKQLVEVPRHCINKLVVQLDYRTHNTVTGFYISSLLHF